MAITPALLRASSKHWTATATLGTTTYPLMKIPSRSIGFDQQRSTCSIEIAERPTCVKGDSAVVVVTLNGEDSLFFVGQVDSLPVSDQPLAYTVALTDVLNFIDGEVKEKFVWNNVPWATAVRSLLNMTGIPDSAIAGIHDPGSVFALGPNYEIKIAKKTKIADLLSQLMTFAGASLRVTIDGKISVEDSPGYPAETSDVVYAYGADAETELGIFKSRRTLGGIESSVYKFTASGPRAPVKMIPDPYNPGHFIPDPQSSDKRVPDATFTIASSNGRTESETYAYCQTDACAEAIARREIVRRNRASTMVVIDAPLNPLILPGQTILFRNEDLYYPTNTPGIIIGITNSDDMMTMQVSVGRNVIEGTLTFTPPPSSDFAMDIERQPIRLSGQVSTNVVVACRSLATDPNGLEIVSLRWTATCAGSVEPMSAEWSKPGEYDPPNDAGKTPIFVFSTLVGALITLEAESESGEGSITTKGVSAGDGQIFTRRLGTATLEGWRVLAHESGWRSFGTNATAVPNINEYGPFLAGFADGKIYQTEDDLLTEPVLLTTLEGPINNIYIDEQDGQTITVAHNTKVSRSMDAGVTWTLLHSFPDPCYFAAHESGSPAVIRACVGNVLYGSTNGGGAWSAIHTGPSGSVCRGFARASWGVAAVFSGVNSESDAIFFEGGGTVDWSAVSLPPSFGLTAVAPLLNEIGWIVGSEGVNDVTRDGLMDALVYAGTGGAGRIYKVIQSGGGWKATHEAPITYAGTFKILNYTAAFQIDDGATGTFRIGYGATTEPPQPPEILFLANGTNQLWHYLDASGWTPKTMPYTASIWNFLVVNPINVAQWMACGDEQVFWTADSGNSWTQIVLPQGGNGGGGVSLAWTGRGANWVLSKQFESWYGTGRNWLSYLASGNGPRLTGYKSWGGLHSPTYPPIVLGKNNAEGFYGLLRLRTGYGGEIIATGTRTSEGVIPSQTDCLFVVNGALTISQTTEEYYWQPQDLWLGTDRQTIATQVSNVGYANNYTLIPDPVIAAGSVAVSVEAGVFVGTDQGVAHIVDFGSIAPSLSVVSAGGRNVMSLVRGRRRKGVVGWCAPTTEATGTMVFFGGDRWGVVAPPVTPSGTPIIALVEV